MTTSHDMTTLGQGSNSRLNTAQRQQGSPENADRLLAERRNTSPAGSHSDSLGDQYAERAAAREANRHEHDELLKAEQASRERRKREGLGDRWQAEADITVNRYADPAEELAAARQSLAEFTERAEGEELAARITNSRLAPWL